MYEGVGGSIVDLRIGPVAGEDDLVPEAESVGPPAVGSRPSPAQHEKGWALVAKPGHGLEEDIETLETEMMSYEEAEEGVGIDPVAGPDLHHGFAAFEAPQPTRRTSMGPSSSRERCRENPLQSHYGSINHALRVGGTENCLVIKGS